MLCASIIKWVPENLYTFSMAGYIVNVYKFSGTHFSWQQDIFMLQLVYLQKLQNLQ